MDIKWGGDPVKRDNYWYASARAAAERARPYSINTLVAIMASDKWCVKSRDMDEFCNDLRREYPDMLAEKTPKRVLDTIIDGVADDVVADDVVADDVVADDVDDVDDVVAVRSLVGGLPLEHTHESPILHYVYEVVFSLGDDLENVVLRFQMLDLPTELKVEKFIEYWLRMQQGVVGKDGLPNPSVLNYAQCLHLLREYGLPEVGYIKECLNLINEDGNILLGHIGTSVVMSAYDISF
jgi:hypothetical protein